MSRQFQEADQLRDQLSALGVMVHDREKTWEVKPGFGGAPAAALTEGTTSARSPDNTRASRPPTTTRPPPAPAASRRRRPP